MARIKFALNWHKFRVKFSHDLLTNRAAHVMPAKKKSQEIQVIFVSDSHEFFSHVVRNYFTIFSCKITVHWLQLSFHAQIHVSVSIRGRSTVLVMHIHYRSDTGLSSLTTFPNFHERVTFIDECNFVKFCNIFSHFVPFLNNYYIRTH